MKNKKHPQNHATKPRRVVPSQLLSQIQHRENRKNRQRDEFLNRLQLRRRKLIRSNPVRRHLKAVLKESDPPADKNHLPQRLAPVFQVPIPRKRHENIGNRQQQDRSHASFSPPWAQSPAWETEDKSRL